jgi:hypothetical protein
VKVDYREPESLEQAADLAVLAAAERGAEPGALAPVLRRCHRGRPPVVPAPEDLDLLESEPLAIDDDAAGGAVEGLSVRLTREGHEIALLDPEAGVRELLRELSIVGQD